MYGTIKKRILAVLLLLLLVFCSLPLTDAVRAEGTQLEIRSAADWLAFVRNCRTDAYSTGLQVELKADLDLTGQTEVMVPVFCGTFNGGGHTIQGIWIDAGTDTVGLFRVLGADAVVSNLHLNGCVWTEDKRTETGILCGKNQGTISGCSVSGFLKGYDCVGGVAGTNSGLIESSVSSAAVRGTTRTGGIAGLSDGRISDCSNSGFINPDANEVAMNAGGIVGTNAGKLTGCSNHGVIGYLHTGYNIGGIAGLNQGFLQNSLNDADVFGRRDTGGIAGQMEPEFRIEYGKNAMKLLDNNISGFTSSLENTVGTLESAVNQGAYGLNEVMWRATNLVTEFSGNVSGLFSGMTWIGDAQNYIALIRGELEYIKNSLPGQTDITAIIEQIEVILDMIGEQDPAKWAEQLEVLSNLLGQLITKICNIPLLKENVSNISAYFKLLSDTVIAGFQTFGNNSSWLLEYTASELSGLRTTISDFLATTTSDIGNVRQSISDTVSMITALQNSVQDVLDGKTSVEEDLSAQVDAKENGMIVSCVNSGNVSGDYNVGGILGNLSAELSMDQESDALPSVDDLLFTDTTMFVRATVYSCSNQGDISAKYDHTGGIIGYGTRGSMISCENTGNIKSSRDYAGGAAGYFRGNLVSDYSIGKVSGVSYVGGLAGLGKAIGQCATVPELEATGANVGAVAGSLDTGSGNVFVNSQWGGVNGISYAAVSKAVSYEELIAMEGMPDCFRTLKVRFVKEGELVKEVQIPYGGSCTESPAVPDADGQYWRWNAYTQENICSNQIVEGSWKNYITTIATSGDIPLFLAEGEFNENAILRSEQLSHGNRKNLLSKDPRKTSSYRVWADGSDAETLKVHFLTDTNGQIFLQQEGTLVPVSQERNGRYLVFELPNGSTFQFIESVKMDRLEWYLEVFLILNCALAAAGILVLILTAIGRRKKQNS